MSKTVTDLTRGVYRRLYSGFTKGQRINKLSLPAEAWFWRVLATVDDFGNGDADPELCRAATAGRRQNTTAKQVSGWLREMRDVGLIQFYTVNGEKFLHVVGFEENQPAGKNGTRIQRFRPPEGIQVNPDESEIIRDNPDVVSASDNDNDNEDDNDTDSRAIALDLPPFTGDLFLSTLSNFEDHRKEIKKPLKPTGRKHLYRQLAGMGEQRAVVAMETSIANGWQGVFEPKENQNGNRQRETASQRNVRNIKESLEYINGLSERRSPPDFKVTPSLLPTSTGSRRTEGGD